MGNVESSFQNQQKQVQTIINQALDYRNWYDNHATRFGFRTNQISSNDPYFKALLINAALQDQRNYAYFQSALQFIPLGSAISSVTLLMLMDRVANKITDDRAIATVIKQLQQEGYDVVQNVPDLTKNYSNDVETGKWVFGAKPRDEKQMMLNYFADLEQQLKEQGFYLPGITDPTPGLLDITAYLKNQIIIAEASGGIGVNPYRAQLLRKQLADMLAAQKLRLESNNATTEKRSRSVAKDEYWPDQSNLNDPATKEELFFYKRTQYYQAQGANAEQSQKMAAQDSAIWIAGAKDPKAELPYPLYYIKYPDRHITNQQSIRDFTANYDYTADNKVWNDYMDAQPKGQLTPSWYRKTYTATQQQALDNFMADRKKLNEKFNSLDPFDVAGLTTTTQQLAELEANFNIDDEAAKIDAQKSANQNAEIAQQADDYDTIQARKMAEQMFPGNDQYFNPFGASSGATGNQVTGSATSSGVVGQSASVGNQ